MGYLENLKKLKAELLEHKSGYVELSILSGKVNVERSTALHILDSSIATCELAHSLGGSQIDEMRRALTHSIFKDLKTFHKERFKTDLEIDVESLVGKLFRSDTLEAIRVYAVDHVGKYVYAEVVPNNATGRPVLSAEVKRYPGYSLDVKGYTVKKEPPQKVYLTSVSPIMGEVFNTCLHGPVEVIGIDTSARVIYAKPTSKCSVGRPMISDAIHKLIGYNWSCAYV